jgi:hypothetical protein
LKFMERETGFEPATSTLARSHSTTELLPLACMNYNEPAILRQMRQPLPSLRDSDNFPLYPALRLRLRAGLDCSAPTALFREPLYCPGEPEALEQVQSRPPNPGAFTRGVTADKEKIVLPVRFRANLTSKTIRHFAGLLPSFNSESSPA